ncbi:MAG: DUF3987 domain-containing protein [Methylophaga sp.]|nr:DUF3987 domain-containing protein [Methylophaga sp.]
MTSDLMPVPLREWLSDVSHRMQTPADFSTISALVVYGSVIGSGCAIRPKSVDTWEVIPNIWGTCIGQPSVMLKTPSMQEVMHLLDRLQAEYGKVYEQERALSDADDFIRETILKDMKNKIKVAVTKKGNTPQDKSEEVEFLRSEYAALKSEGNEGAARRLFKTNESSIQSMTVLQNQNERGLLVFRDELTGLLVRWDRDDHSDERAYYLEGWNGNGSYTDVKIGRGLTDAKNICISLLGGIQPDKLKRYLYQAMKGNNDGLMQRLQLAVWPDVPKNWQLIDTVPNKEQKQHAYDLLATLADIDFIQAGATQGEYDDRPYFKFNDEAQTIFNDWLTQLQTVKIENEDNPLMVEHFGKFRSLMPSLALIFHCIDIADGTARGNITAKSAQLAVEWCDYLESHARRIYAMAESPEHESAIRLSNKIKSKQVTAPFTAKSIYDKGWHGLKNRSEVEAACNILIDENWLVMEIKRVTGMKGRPPAPEYLINPSLL